MNTQKTILLIEDEPTMRLGLQHFLSSKGFDVTVCVDGEEGCAALQREEYDLVITDLRLPKKNGFEVLTRTHAVAPATGVIMMTAFADVKDAVQAIKEGAFDYIAKPFSNDELMVILDRFFAFRKLQSEVQNLRRKLGNSSVSAGFIGESAAMQSVFDRIEAVASTDAPVLILGESGTGKELVANAIHELSARSDGPFVKINCAAIPENLFESELFGYEKGAFTGATETRKGKFAAACGGTIFFDEIAEVPLTLQPKLLRAVEEKLITRLGTHQPTKVNVRSMYATSRNLKELVASGAFREDLFYRINVVPITLPPLRERLEDIPYLVDFFVQTYAEQFSRGPLTVSSEAYSALLAYRYPGNVRELKHAIERAVIFAKNGVIELQHLPDEISATLSNTPCLKERQTLQESIKCMEKTRIMKALAETSGKKQDAARLLGIGRKALWKKMRDYGIDEVSIKKQ
jgi:DNA-binding NtrC family response regulator